MTRENIIGILIVSLFVGSVLAELILELSWNKRYFTSGLPIFMRRIPVSHWHTNIPSHALLEQKFHSDVISSLIFKQISADAYIFCERRFQFKWIRTPNLMHGWLIFDRNRGEVIVLGFMNLSAIAFYTVLLGSQLVSFILMLLNGQPAPSFMEPVVASTIIVLFSILLYEIQAARFSIVASFSAESWSRKYVRDRGGEV